MGTDISVGADGAVTGYSDDDVWTVVANDDGTYSFQQDGQSIGLADRYASMDLGAVNDDWKLIDLGNGLYNIKNTVRGNYMEWYTQYSNWSTYNSSSAATDDQFQLSFYKVTGETPDPEPSEAPFEANDTIVIYAPSNNMALSATVKNELLPRSAWRLLWRETPSPVTVPPKFGQSAARMVHGRSPMAGSL